MEDRLIVTASPHIRDTSTTRGLMGNVVIALLPAVLAAGLIFGVQALVLVAVTTLACVAFEYIYEKLLKKSNTVGDLSAVVTGIILALILTGIKTPAAVSYTHLTLPTNSRV